MATVNISSERLEELVIQALEWSIECSEQITHDLIGGMSITSDELELIGYDKENFPSMHKATER